MTSSTFEKRVKRRITARPHDFFAVCPPGLRQICRHELSALDAPIRDIRVLPGGVGFTSKLSDACHANLSLGSPVRILMRVAHFKTTQFQGLENQLRRVDWELLLAPPVNLDIRVTTHKSRLYHSGAIADRCRAVIGEGLPLSGSGPASCQTLMIRADKDIFTLSLDMSGAPLFKRGVKQKVTGAPLRENLAFAILARTGFRPGDVLLDPMCGSGTFSIEAAMIQSRIPPGFFRSFAAEHWPGFRPAQFNYLKRQAQSRFRIPGPAPIWASDTDPSAVSALDANLEGHEFLNAVHPRCLNFFDLAPHRLTKEKGVIVLNPPYGKRLSKGADINGFYREIENKLTKDFSGWRIGIVLPEREMKKVKNLCLSPFPFVHGGLNLVAGVGQI